MINEDLGGINGDACGQAFHTEARRHETTDICLAWPNIHLLESVVQARNPSCENPRDRRLAYPKAFLLETATENEEGQTQI